MAFDSLEVLIEFADAADLGRAFSHEGVYRQSHTPETWVEVKRATKNERERVRFEQDQRVKKNALAMSGGIARARTLCNDCKKRMPGTGWCPSHTESVMLQRGEREKLPIDRKGVTWHFTLYTRENEEIKGYVTTGEYPDGRLGEIFVKMGKSGEAGAWIDEWAKDFSLTLQLGYSLEKLCKMHMHTQFDPCGATGSQDKDLARCTSVVDLVCKWALKKYGPPKPAGIEVQP